ncbi:MAG: aminotransferase class V-fold PLP-dependent enzyme [Candidatus Lokiarchaeota archaeon]|nr:aminotransferase class V-fold PLP-dependent enzyme [Candidatus Lokiarchaeota archaeon]
MKVKVYFDNSATTPVDDRVVEAMLPYFTKYFGNASSLHSFGQEAQEAVDRSRALIADKLNANYDELIFTSGGSESDNLALKGVARDFKGRGKDHIITSKIEHPAILNTAMALEKEGFKLTYLDVDEEGFIDFQQLEDSITDETILVSIMQANNEIGTIQDLKRIGEICKENDVYFHSDVVQAFTKVPLNVKEFNLDLVSITGHKIHGPKGIGALYVTKDLQKKMVKMVNGGAHESNLRSGTENVPGIVGFAKAVEIAQERYINQMANLRNYIIKSILDQSPETYLNGPNIDTKGDKRLCNNVNISINYIEGEAILLMLDDEGIAVSTGSACASKKIEASHVLQAIGCTVERGLNGTIRVSLSRFNTKKEADYFLEKLKGIIDKLRQMSPLYSG